MYSDKIEIIVQSKYPEVLKVFLSGFKPTTFPFRNLTLHIFDGSEYGAKAINKVVEGLYNRGIKYFGVFNDDLWFSEGWLESVLEWLPYSGCVSAGYVETGKEEVFKRAVEATKNEKGAVPHLYGPNAIFNVSSFKRVGIFDERFDWSCDDLDWAWRYRLSGVGSVTMKRITMAHTVGVTRTKSNEAISAWNVLSTKNKQRFYDKHGYQSYRDIRAEYKQFHKYFQQFR